MANNERTIENVITLDFLNDAKECNYTPYEYVKKCIEANDYYFFNDGDVEQLNNDLLTYLLSY